MIIDKLKEEKKQKIAEHKKNFSDDYEGNITFEMFQKKYDGSYYTDSQIEQPFFNKLPLSQSQALLLKGSKNIDVKTLLKLDDKIYSEIINFPDYDYLNSIAYEMLRRTKEYKGFRDSSNRYTHDEREKGLDQLGIDFNDAYDLKIISDVYNPKKVNKSFTHTYLKMTLDEIDKGIDKLIEFYVNKQEIYIIDNEKEMLFSYNFKVVPNITVEEVKTDMSNYFIPTKAGYEVENFSKIDNSLLLAGLEVDFIDSISDLIPNRIKGAIEFNFTQPLLRFKEMPIVDVPLNLNLSKEELIQLVTKLKNDFENKSLRSPMSILLDKNFKLQNLNEVTPFKMTKKAMAEAFYIYDLYQNINSIMSLHKKNLNKLQKLDKETIEKQIQNDIENAQYKIDIQLEEKEKNNKQVKKWFIKNLQNTFKEEKRRLEKEKKEQVTKITKEYKRFSKEYHPMIVLKDLAITYEITPYMCKQYLKFMRKYIDKLKYKELIIGINVT